MFYTAEAVNHQMPKSFSMPDVDGGLIGGASLVAEFHRNLNHFKMSYLECKFRLNPFEPYNEIIVAQL